MAVCEVYGIHAVLSLLKNEQREAVKLFLNTDRKDKRLAEVYELAKEKKVPIFEMTLKEMQSRYPDYVHQGVVLLAEPLPSYKEIDLEFLLQTKKTAKLFILILDGVTDPHNFGACIRTADAAGVDFIIVPKDNSAPMSAIVTKVSSGASENMPVVRVTNLARTIESLKKQGVWVYGADENAPQTLYNLDAKGDIAIVMGSEGYGLRQLTKSTCDGLFSLPMHGSVESLNVSVATGISLYEVVRQRYTR